MPVLDNPQWEMFALDVATGLSPARAYVRAGFSPNGARQSAHRLLTNADVSARVLEVRTALSERIENGIVVRDIAKRQARLDELQARWDLLRDTLSAIIEERGADMENETPGGGTGFIARDYKGAGVVALDTELDGDSRPVRVKEFIKVFRIDAGVADLVRLLLEHERRAAEELGQWSEKLEDRVKPVATDKPDLDKLSPDELRTILALLDKAKGK